jgi:photosystem II stability/assembly factor-like uncharacterized protein
MLFKSTDEGLTWKEITGHGLPTNMAGRTSIAVAMNTNAQRMFLIGNFGFFRSDDGGENWHQMAANDQRIRNGQNGYNCGVYVDPQNPDLVYTINTSSFISRDGGNTFTGFKGAPGGDDPQQMWIDPTNGKRMILGVDQGATVSLDGGLTWSSWYNQATDQVYHISADNSYPYWVYATQQDAGSIATRSRGDLGAITPLDWYPTAGYEFGSIVADPLNPKIIYAGGPGGGIVKITYPSGQWINVSPNVDASEALRKVGNQPILWAPTNPRELLVGFQYLMSTTDGGMHWKKLGPDLTVSDSAAAAEAGGRGAGGRGAPAAAAGGGGRGAAGGAIESFSPSTMSAGIIWVGTNNGLIKLSRNHGTTWRDVSIPNLPNPTRADVSAIDASHTDSAEAYVAIDYHTSGDYTPYFYRTRDFGKTWTKIVSGMRTDQPSGSFARVIRADTKKPGLLFAGTESSMYGLVRRRRRLAISHAESAEYVVSRHRDQRQRPRDRNVRPESVDPRRFFPAAADHTGNRIRGGASVQAGRRDSRAPQRERRYAVPAGSSACAQPAARRASSTITCARNRRATSRSTCATRPGLSCGTTRARRLRRSTSHRFLSPITGSQRPKPMPADVGTNRINWDIRYDSPPAFAHSYAISANEGETPPSPQGPLALPGTYTLTLTVDGKAYTQTVNVKNDPRSPASPPIYALSTISR